MNSPYRRTSTVFRAADRAEKPFVGIGSPSLKQAKPLHNVKIFGPCRRPGRADGAIPARAALFFLLFKRRAALDDVVDQAPFLRLVGIHEIVPLQRVDHVFKVWPVCLT